MSAAPLVIETRERVRLIRFDRPKVLNALNSAVMGALVSSLEAADADDGIGAVVVTGSEKAFAAGADIAEMAQKTYMDMHRADMFSLWQAVAKARKPLIAGVQGYALGGGCELAMMCDIIIAGVSAKFGQPEITLGVMPGAGGTQRLVRAVGKAKAMDLCLTGRLMGAEEAERAGLIARVVPDAQVMAEALAVAEKIASFSLPAVVTAKEAILRAFETTLEEGLRFERRLFHAMFATQDQKEGMAAFLAKRAARFRHE